MRTSTFAFAAVLAALGCTLSPVITTPEPRHGDGYEDCRRAAEDYCHHVRGAPDTEMDRCVADATYACVSGKRPR